MSKKFIFIVSILFIVQISVYVLTGTDIAQKYEIILSKKSNEPNLFEIYPNYKDLKIIKLEAKSYSRFPRELLLMENLEEVYLSNNSLSAFPYELLELPKLKKIILKGNKIKTVKFETIKGNKTLQILDLSDNKITKAVYFSRLARLEELDLSNNAVSSFAIFNPNLKSIDLSKNKLNSFPEITSNALKTLNLSENKLTQLDLGIIPQNLNYLDVQKNKIKTVVLDNATEFIKKSHLKEVNLAHNSLTKFPNDLLFSKYLHNLNLSYNKIKTWNYIAYYVSVTELNLSHNFLSQLPQDWTTSFLKIKKMDISNNLFSTIKIKSNVLQTLIMNNNTFAMVELDLPNLRSLTCNREAFNRQTNNINAPELEVCNVLLKEEEKKLDAEIEERYKRAMFFYK